MDCWDNSLRCLNSHACDWLTQISFVKLDLFHHRCHDKGEGLPVEKVQRVADEHATEDGRTIVAIACGPHVNTGFNGCKQTTWRLMSQSNVLTAWVLWSQQHQPRGYNRVVWRRCSASWEALNTFHRQIWQRSALYSHVQICQPGCFFYWSGEGRETLHQSENEENIKNLRQKIMNNHWILRATLKRAWKSEDLLTRRIMGLLQMDLTLINSCNAACKTSTWLHTELARSDLLPGWRLWSVGGQSHAAQLDLT